ncbi:hypothetical protein GCM10020229_62500 [Kitasatospora albolonga]
MHAPAKPTGPGSASGTPDRSTARVTAGPAHRFGGEHATARRAHLEPRLRAYAFTIGRRML